MTVYKKTVPKSPALRIPIIPVYYKSAVNYYIDIV